jgi:hypothetical protein
MARRVTLIAVVALTMGLALDVIGGAHRGHVAPVAPERLSFVVWVTE